MNDPVATANRRRLGRGLNALLGSGAPASQEVEHEETATLRELPVSAIEANPFQPRKDFDAETLKELTDSIRQHGVLQPVLVRELENGYQLVAGERRWQAAQKAGLNLIPCKVIDVVDQTACEFALEENLKRKDLGDLEKAQAFRNYLDQFQTTIEELAKQLSMSRSAVSNLLRLLELPEPVKNALRGGKLTAGHARAMLSLPEVEQLALSGRIQAEGLSVRKTEAIVREQLNPQRETIPIDDADDKTEPEPTADATRTNHVRSLEEQLRNALGVKVTIQLSGKDKGKIVIPFGSNAEFEGVVKSLRKSAA